MGLQPGGMPAFTAASEPLLRAARSPLLRQECDPYYAEMEPDPNPHRNFYFARGWYSSGGGGFYGRSWSVDFPKADRQFLYVLERTLGWDVHPCETPVRLDDPQLRRYPFLYILEVGGMGLSEPEVEGFRDYLLAGGFVFVDDFWGEREWANFEREMGRVLPDHEIVDVPMDHMIFRIVYPIDEVLQVPNRGNGRRGDPRFYGECGGPCPPEVRGIFDEDGRLMVLITWNSDLGDAWEWAEDPYYPYDRSNYAFSLAFNAITYAMTY